MSKKSIVIIIVVLILGGGIYWYYTQNKADINIPSLESPQASETNQNTNTPSTIFSKVAETRDLKRFSDLRTIQAALSAYFGENQSYPGSLEELSDYLEVVPRDPQYPAKEYVYTPIGASPYKFYDLSYTLEVGIEGIGAGQHVATPSSIATY